MTLQPIVSKKNLLCPHCYKPGYLVSVDMELRPSFNYSRAIAVGYEGVLRVLIRMKLLRMACRLCDYVVKWTDIEDKPSGLIYSQIENGDPLTVEIYQSGAIIVQEGDHSDESLEAIRASGVFVKVIPKVKESKNHGKKRKKGQRKGSYPYSRKAKTLQPEGSGDSTESC